MIAKAIRFCESIACFALDFPRTTCVFRTPFCTNCYNVKMDRMYGEAMLRRDRFNLEAWQECKPEDWKHLFDSKRTRQTSRFRFATRGEALYSEASLNKIVDIALLMPHIQFWVPTRGWRNSLRRAQAVKLMLPMPNIKVMASIDPTNTPEEVQSLKDEGWSTMFYGDNTAIEGRRLCPKTWEKRHGCCATCVGGCFATERVDIHLKRH